MTFSYCKGGIPAKVDGTNQIKWNAWPRTIECDWQTLVSTYLYRRNTVPHTYEDGSAIDQERDAKTCLPSISGAVYAPGDKRGKDYIQSINLLVMDIDNKGEPDTWMTWEQGAKLATNSPYRMCLYTTYSSTVQRNKFRIVVPLERGVRPDLWKEFLEYSIDALGLSQFREAMDLGCMRRPSQVFFLQGAWDGEEGIQIEWKDGIDLAVPTDDVLEVITLPYLPGEGGRRKLESGELRYIKSCNVDLVTLDLCAVLKHKGIRVGPDQEVKDGTKNRCHCPWGKEHTGGRDDDGAYIVQIDNKWPIFHCSHSNHQDLQLVDVLDWAGPAVVALYGDPYVRPTKLKNGNLALDEGGK